MRTQPADTADTSAAAGPSGAPSSLAIYDATSATFDALVFEPRGELVVVDFWGDGCPNCEVFAADAPGLLAALGDVPVRVVKVDAYTHDDVARRFAIFGIPTFLLVRDGLLLGKMSQYYGKEYWLRVIRENLPGAGGPVGKAPPPRAS